MPPGRLCMETVPPSSTMGRTPVRSSTPIRSTVPMKEKFAGYTWRSPRRRLAAGSQVRRFGRREQLGRQHGELTVEGLLVSGVAFCHQLLEFGAAAHEFRELLDQGVYVHRVRELVELGEPHVRHKRDELSRVSKGNCRLAELQRTHHVVITRGYDDADGRHLRNQLAIRGGRFRGDPGGGQIRPVAAQVGHDLLSDLAIELAVTAEQPDLVTVIN